MFNTLVLALGYVVADSMFMRHALGPTQGLICGCDTRELLSLCEFISCIEDHDDTCTDRYQVTDSVEYQITEAALANQMLSLPLLHIRNTTLFQAYLAIDNDVDCASGIVYLDDEPATQDYTWMIEKNGSINLARIIFPDWPVGDNIGETISFACNKGSFIFDPYILPKIQYSFIRHERD